MAPTDEQLIVATATGDRDAFAELYVRLRPPVYRFAVHMTGSASAADDVVQETFLAVIHDARRYQAGRSGVVPWLLGIARNHARRRLARERSVDPLPAGDVPRSLWVGAGQHQSLERDDEIAGLRAALAGVPATYREAVVLCDLQELSYADAAVALGCAIGTVRSRLHRGRALLAEKMRRRERNGTWRVPGWIA